MFDNRVIYISELGYPDGYIKIDEHRLPQAYISELNWFVSSYSTLKRHVQENDILIFQTPTDDELYNLKIIESYIDTNFVFITQESCIFDWYDWTAEEQALYIKLLDKCNAFLYHSEYDKQVMTAYCDNFVYYPGCTNQFYEVDKNFEDGEYISIPGPIKRYQRGMLSHKLAVDSIPNGHQRIFSMTYKRPTQAGDKLLSFPDNYKLDRIQHLDYMSKDKWKEFIYGSKFGIDMNRDFSGGNVCIEYAALGTPLVGNINLDYQRNLFPDISFEFNDTENIKKAIKRLNTDKDFYNYVKHTAIQRVKDIYSSKVVTKKFGSDLMMKLTVKL